VGSRSYVKEVAASFKQPEAVEHCLCNLGLRRKHKSIYRSIILSRALAELSARIFEDVRDVADKFYLTQC